MYIYPTFIAAISALVTAIHREPGPFSELNGFTIKENRNYTAYRVEGEAWTFYVIPSKDGFGETVGWEVIGWPDLSKHGLTAAEFN